LHLSIRNVFAVVIGISGFLMACGSPPPATAPTPVATVPQTPTQPQVPQVPTVAEVRLEGPETIPLGETAEFRLIARWTDGSSPHVVFLLEPSVCPVAV